MDDFAAGIVEGVGADRLARVGLNINEHPPSEIGRLLIELLERLVEQIKWYNQYKSAIGVLKGEVQSSKVNTAEVNMLIDALAAAVDRDVAMQSAGEIVTVPHYNTRLEFFDHFLTKKSREWLQRVGIMDLCRQRELTRYTFTKELAVRIVSGILDRYRIVRDTLEWLRKVIEVARIDTSLTGQMDDTQLLRTARDAFKKMTTSRSKKGDRGLRDIYDRMIGRYKKYFEFAEQQAPAYIRMTTMEWAQFVAKKEARLTGLSSSARLPRLSILERFISTFPTEDEGNEAVKLLVARGYGSDAYNAYSPKTTVIGKHKRERAEAAVSLSSRLLGTHTLNDVRKVQETISLMHDAIRHYLDDLGPDDEDYKSYRITYEKEILQLVNSLGFVDEDEFNIFYDQMTDLRLVDHADASEDEDFSDRHTGNPRALRQ